MLVYKLRRGSGRASRERQGRGGDGGRERRSLDVWLVAAKRRARKGIQQTGRAAAGKDRGDDKKPRKAKGEQPATRLTGPSSHTQVSRCAVRVSPDATPPRPLFLSRAPLAFCLSASPPLRVYSESLLVRGSPYSRIDTYAIDVLTVARCFRSRCWPPTVHALPRWCNIR